MAGAMQRALLTVVALWLPLLPFFFIMRHIIRERSGMHAPAHFAAPFLASTPVECPSSRPGYRSSPAI